jgi:hypothetical protein
MASTWSEWSVDDVPAESVSRNSSSTGHVRSMDGLERRHLSSAACRPSTAGAKCFVPLVDKKSETADDHAVQTFTHLSE